MMLPSEIADASVVVHSGFCFCSIKTVHTFTHLLAVHEILFA